MQAYDNAALNCNAMMSCAGGLERKGSASLGTIMRMVIPRYFLRSHGAVGLPNRCCSEVFAFGVDPTEMILGEVRRGNSDSIHRRTFCI